MLEYDRNSREPLETMGNKEFHNPKKAESKKKINMADHHILAILNISRVFFHPRRAPFPAGLLEGK